MGERRPRRGEGRIRVDMNASASDIKSRFLALGVLLGAGFLPSACSSGPQWQGKETGGAALPTGVDASRAFADLDRIEPRIETPKRPESLTPLSERAAKQIASAKRLIDDQRYTEASLELERALRFDPNHYEIHRALTLLHWQAGNIERARNHAARAIEGNPDCAAAHYVLGRCAAIAGDKAAALTALRTAVLCSDLNEDAETAVLCRYHLAQGLAAEGYSKAALSQFDAFEKAAAEVGPSATRLELTALLRSTRGKAGEERSKVLENLGRPGEAADALAPTVAAFPNDMERGKRFARLLSLAGRYDEALAAARAVPADDADFVAFLFDLHQRAGHPERIVDDLRVRVAAKPDDPQPVLQLADALVRLNKPKDAGAELRTFLQRHPEAQMVRVKWLESLESDRDWTGLLTACAEGIRQSPDRAAEFETVLRRASKEPAAAKAILQAATADDVVGQYLRGMVASESGDSAQAISLWERSLQLDAKFIPARVALAEFHLKAHRYDDVLRVAARSDADRSEDSRLERLLGQAYDRLDDPDRAEFHYRAATQLDRADVASMFALAELHLRSDKALRAQQQLRVLLEKDPDHESARELLAFTYLKDNKRDVFNQEIQELKKRTKSPTTLARCRSVLEPNLIRDKSERRQLLLDAMQEGQPDAVTWIAVAETYDDTEAKSMRDAYQRAVELDPENEDAALGVVRTTRLLLDFEGAARQLEALLPLRPNRHDWKLSLIELHSIAQEYDKALALASTEANRLDLPEDRLRAYRNAYVGLLIESGKAKEAAAWLEGLAEHDSAKGEWKRKLAEAYFADKRPNDAARVYADLVENGPRDNAPRERLIASLAEADRHDRALQFVLDWLGSDPENDSYVSLFVRLLADGERAEDAMEVARSRLLRTPNREWFQDFLLQRLSAQKQHAEALELAESLLGETMDVMRTAPQAGGGRRPLERPGEDRMVLRPNEPSTIEALRDRMEDLRVEIARQLIFLERYREAEQQIQGWLAPEDNPQSRARYLFALADCQRWQGNETAAGETLDQVRALLPTHPTLNNDIAYMWIDRGERLDEAESLIRYALGRAPRQAAYLDTYGWLLYKRGDFAGAKIWLIRANHARDGADPVIHDHLGDTLWRLGDKAQAVEHWRTAIERSNERKPDVRINADEQRVRDVAPRKIEDAGAGQAPPIAPLEGATPPVPKSGS